VTGRQKHTTMRRTALLVLVPALLAGLGGCAVVSIAGAAAGAAIEVGGAVAGTTVRVTGKVIEKAIDVVMPSSPEELAR